jgi:hypothetical protein
MHRSAHLPRLPRWLRLPRWTFAALAILLFAAARPAPVRADEMISIHGHAGAVKLGNRTQPARDSTATVWLAADRLRRDEGGVTVIVRLDRHMLYLINHADRTYSQVQVPIDWAKMVPPSDQESFTKFLADNEINATITPSTESRKIRTWNTHRVDVLLTNKHGLKMATHMWLSTDLPLYAEYNKMAAILASLQPNASSWSQKVGSLDGIPVYQETTITIGQSESQTLEEIVAADTKPAPPGTYDVPAGFTAVPYDPFHTPQ